MLAERTDIQCRPTNLYLVTTKRYHEQSTKSTTTSSSIILSSYNAATINCNKAGSTTHVRNWLLSDNCQQCRRNPESITKSRTDNKYNSGLSFLTTVQEHSWNQTTHHGLQQLDDIHHLRCQLCYLGP
eukprot:2029203-Amphidinium_carterae.2